MRSGHCNVCLNWPVTKLVGLPPCSSDQLVAVLRAGGYREGIAREGRQAFVKYRGSFLGLPIVPLGRPEIPAEALAVILEAAGMQHDEYERRLYEIVEA